MGESTKRMAAMAELGETLVALDAEHVVGVEMDDEDREVIIDVPELFALPLEGERSRVIAFDADAGNVGVRMGAKVWFEEFDPNQVRAVPAFLEGMKARNAVVGVLEREDKMVLLLDIECLRGLDRGAEP